VPPGGPGSGRSARLGTTRAAPGARWTCPWSTSFLSRSLRRPHLLLLRPENEVNKAIFVQLSNMRVILAATGSVISCDTVGEKYLARSIYVVQQGSS
jgi:hypothetical protein